MARHPACPLGTTGSGETTPLDSPHLPLFGQPGVDLRLGRARDSDLQEEGAAKPFCCLQKSSKC